MIHDGLKPFAGLAVKFASALIAGDFVTAHAMLSRSLQRTQSPQSLRDSYLSMFNRYSDGQPNRVVFDLEWQSENWPGKQARDCGWVYVAVTNDYDISEAVAVIVADEDAGLVIREIEWGRP